MFLQFYGRKNVFFRPHAAVRPQVALPWSSQSFLKALFVKLYWVQYNRGPDFIMLTLLLGNKINCVNILSRDRLLITRPLGDGLIKKFGKHCFSFSVVCLNVC